MVAETTTATAAGDGDGIAIGIDDDEPTAKGATTTAVSDSLDIVAGDTTAASDIAVAPTTEVPETPSVEVVIAEDEEGCLTALAEVTGQGCLNGGVCKWKRADCTDGNANFTEPVCDCGGRGGSVSTCFWGRSCENKVDSCPGDTRSCNIVRKVKSTVDPANLVCSSNEWPERLCSKDDPNSGWSYKVSASAVQQGNNGGDGAEDGDAGASAGAEEDGAESKKDPAGLVAGLVVAILFLIVAVIIVSKRRSDDKNQVAELQSAQPPAKTNPAYQYVLPGHGAAGAGGAGPIYAGVDSAASSAPACGADYSELSEGDMAVGLGLRRGGSAAAASGATYEEAVTYEEIDANGIQRGQPGYLEPIAAGAPNYLEPVSQPQYGDVCHGQPEYTDIAPQIGGGAGEAMYDTAGLGGEAMYDTAAASAGGEAMYDTAAGEAMYDQASGGVEESFQLGPASSKGLSKRTSDDLASFKPLTLTRGATGAPALYEFSMAAGDLSSPQYAMANDMEDSEEAAYVLANGDIGAIGSPAEYALASGDVPSSEPTYDTATDDGGYLAVLPGVHSQVNTAAKTSTSTGSSSQENAYNMVPPGVRSSSVSGGGRPKVTHVNGSDPDTSEDQDGGQVTTTEGAVLQANDFV